MRLGDHNALRYAAATGTVLVRWEGAGPVYIWTVPAPDLDPRGASGAQDVPVPPGARGGRIGGGQPRGRPGPAVDGRGPLPPDEDGRGGGRAAQGVVTPEP